MALLLLGVTDVASVSECLLPVTSAVGYGRGVSTLEEANLIAGLRARDEDAFMMLVDQYGASLLRLAQTFVRDRAVAEEVVQETWLGVLRGIDRFEGRSSLKTWLYRILINTAKTRGVRESRSLPFSAFGGDDEGPTVDADRFQDADGRYPGHWRTFPASWHAVPEERLVGRETQEVIRRAIDALPDSQRTVISLRDIEGWSSDEVRNVLELSETNQRVLLHRARAKVRRALEEYLTE
jgi:RNA polymerase sigma-70 factor (ECF subfamily)